MKDRTITHNPILVMVRGLPGSGKTHVVSELQKRIEEDKVVVLDPDIIDYDADEYINFSAQLTLQNVDKKLHPYRYLRSKAYDAISAHKIIFWNQAFTNLDLLDRTIINLQTFSSDKSLTLSCVVVEVEIDPNIARERVKKREKLGGHGVPDDVFERFIKDYESFADYGYITVKINGEEDVATSVTPVAETIEKLITEQNSPN